MLEQLAADDRDFWHGGAAGLQAGSVLVPGNQVAGYSRTFAMEPSEVPTTLGQGWVYVTTDRHLAIDFAAQAGALWGAGAVYAVRPLAALAPDPDFAHFPGVAYRAKRARVIALEEEFDRSMPYSPADAVLRYATWEDGTPMYGEGGLPLPSATLAELGVTARDLAGLGRGAGFDLVNAAASRIVQQLHPGMTQERIDAVRAKHLRRGQPR